MALFGWLSGSKKAPPALKRGRGFTVDAVGEANYQKVLLRLTGGRKGERGVKLDATATLKAEPSNPHDPNAVAVLISGKKVGYIARKQAVDIAALLQAKGIGEATCDARITSGWLNDDDESHFRVKLNISWPPRISK